LLLSISEARYIHLLINIIHFGSALHLLIAIIHFGSTLHLLIAIIHFGNALHLLINIIHFGSALHLLIAIIHFGGALHLFIATIGFLDDIYFPRKTRKMLDELFILWCLPGRRKKREFGQNMHIRSKKWIRKRRWMSSLWQAKENARHRLIQLHNGPRLPSTAWPWFVCQGHNESESRLGKRNNLFLVSAAAAAAAAAWEFASRRRHASAIAV
jgi:hypothetical protein